MPDRALAQFDYLDDMVALCVTVRDRLRAHLPLKDNECQIDYDEIGPPSAGHIYVCITEGGWRPGDAHQHSYDIEHSIYGVVVTVFIRVANLPRDRKMHAVLGDHKFLIAESGLNRLVKNVFKLVDYSYALMNDASALLVESGDTRQGFDQPLVWSGGDPSPRRVPAEMFSSYGSRSGIHADEDVALAKTIRFDGCSRQIARDNVLS